MNKTIYVSNEALWEKLAKNNNMSALINDLLEWYDKREPDVNALIKLKKIEKILAEHNRK